MTTEAAVDDVPAEEVSLSTRLRGILSGTGWALFGLACLAFFTIVKMPDAKIRAYIQAQISSALAPMGIRLTAAQTELSILLRPSYTMKQVSLSVAGAPRPVRLDQITVRPGLLGLLTGRLGGTAEIAGPGGGELRLSGSYSKPKVSVSFDAEDFDLAKSALLEAFAHFKGGAVLSGSGSISVDTTRPESLDGDVELRLTKIKFDQQPIYGFPIPEINLAKGTASVEASDGKVRVKELNLGELKGGTPAGTDDLAARISGKVSLGKQWESSTLDLKVDLGLSEKLLKAFALVDTFLRPGKKPDGSYSYQLTGPIFAPVPQPAK